jgi:hypothetical protein
MTDAALVLAVLAGLFAPTVIGVWLISRRRRALIDARVAAFRRQLDGCRDLATAAEEKR